MSLPLELTAGTETTANSCAMADEGHCAIQ